MAPARRSTATLAVIAALVGCRAAVPRVAPPPVNVPYVCDSSTAIPAGGFARVRVPRGLPIVAGLPGLRWVYRGGRAATASDVVQRTEPPPHTSIELTQITCAIRVDATGAGRPPTCAPTPANPRDNSTSDGALDVVADDTAQHIRACFAVTDHVASASDLRHVEGIAEPWIADEPGPRIVAVRSARIERVPELEPYGCEGVRDRPCDRATRPTGRTIDRAGRQDVALYLLGRSGAVALHGVYPPAAVDLRLLYVTVAAIGDPIIAPALDVSGYHPLDPNTMLYDTAPTRAACYYPALRARLAALDVDPEDQANRLAVLYDQVTLAVLTHDAAAAADGLAALHAALARGSNGPDVRAFVAARVEVLDRLAAGELAVDDPCQAPGAAGRAAPAGR